MAVINLKKLLVLRLSAAVRAFDEQPILLFEFCDFRRTIYSQLFAKIKA